MIRLDKYLADMGIGTRQEVKKYIRQGRVSAGGAALKKPELKIDETKECIAFDGQEIRYAAYEYYMMNKPAGVISATRDGRDRTVLDLIESRKRKDLFPAGRLDKDTEGLLLITNDGALAHRLLSPEKHVDKVYYARVRGIVTDEDVRLFREGVDIGAGEEEERTRPAKLEIIESGPVSTVRLTIQEGKFHQVKRMFACTGKEVVYLKRERMGSLVLDASLNPGEYRRLTEEEIRGL